VVVLVEVGPGQEGVVLAEPARQRLGERGDLDAGLALGEIGQQVRVAFARDRCFEHGPPGDAHDVGGHRRELDAGVLQQLLQVLRDLAALAGRVGPGAGGVAEFPHRLGWHERGPQQTVGAQLRQPRGVGDVGRAAGQVLGVAGVGQDHVQAVGQQVEEGLPVG
jgi:hypothetical protein